MHHQLTLLSSKFLHIVWRQPPHVRSREIVFLFFSDPFLRWLLRFRCSMAAVRTIWCVLDFSFVDRVCVFCGHWGSDVQWCQTAHK